MDAGAQTLIFPDWKQETTVTGSRHGNAFLQCEELFKAI
jgi:hypothetical protein